MRCSHCGSENPEEYRFCGGCGLPLGQGANSPPQAPRTAPLAPDFPADYVVSVESPQYDSTESDEERGARNKRVVLAGGLLSMAAITMACLGCLILVFLLNFSPWSAAPDTSPPAQVSQVEQGAPTDVSNPPADEWTLTVSKTERVKALALANGDTRPAKGTWVVVYATLKNNTTQPVTLAEDDVELVGEGGTVYKPSTGFYAKSFANEKKVTALDAAFPAGASTQLAILFDVDAKAGNLTLRVRPTNETITLP